MVQAVTARRPISTVQAPQAPSPQPNLGPVTPRSSRSTSSRLRSAAEAAVRSAPLTMIVNFITSPAPSAMPFSDCSVIPAVLRLVRSAPSR